MSCLRSNEKNEKKKTKREKRERKQWGKKSKTKRGKSPQGMDGITEVYYCLARTEPWMQFEIPSSKLKSREGLTVTII